MQRKRSVDIVDTTPLPGRDLRGLRRSSHRASNEENTNECATQKTIFVCRSRKKKKTYHALFDVEALHRAFHLLIRVRAWDRRGRRRLSRRRQSLLVVGRHLLRTTPLFDAYSLII